jgi:hypothetical protein
MNLTLRQFRQFLAKRGQYNEVSWDTWWAVLLGAFGETLTPAEAAAYEQFTARKPKRNASYRTIAAFIGRRAGKDCAAAIIVTFLALCREWKVARGETPVVVLLAVDRKQANVAFDYITGLLDAVPEFAALIDSATKDEISLRNGVVIQVATADQASLRGRTVVAAICDEYSFWMENDAVEVPRSLRPAMITQPNAKLIIISSIYGSYGPAFEVFREWGTEDERRLVIRGTTRDFNPTVPQAEIDLELQADPLGAAAEYLTIPRSDVARFIDSTLLDPLTRASPRDVPYTPVSPQGAQYDYRAGLDVSGGRGDATAAAVARLDGERVMICAVRHWPAPHDPLEVARRVASFLKEYGITSAVADQYGAGIVESVYREAGVHLIAAEQSRSDTYLAMLPLLTTGRMEIPDDPTLRRELIALERRPGRSKDVIDHPRHGHDDVANACALSAVCVSKTAGGDSFEATLIESTFFDGYAHSVRGDRYLP